VGAQEFTIRKGFFGLDLVFF